MKKCNEENKEEFTLNPEVKGGVLVMFKALKYPTEKEDKEALETLKVIGDENTIKEYKAKIQEFKNKKY